MRSSRDGVPLTRWIAPEDSICLQVKCMEIVKANDWPGVFCTMRRASWFGLVETRRKRDGYWLSTVSRVCLCS